ncbi:MAG: family N-acetyltransferase [Devosia sp.]|uniref:lipid II:glycine glycyltransferase FemX n=1 Tax=Devosia sp. TaxID=1871048 RepID=UPI00261207EF|nr:GNAT family N-acetyltransferase [Devosia sp.]MDB5539923.1 family N-acetyltransferase [Devosia sp.]
MSLAALSPSPVAQAVASPTRIAFAMRSVTPDAWDDAIAGFEGVCQEQLATFAQARWPDVVLEPLLFHRDEEVVGGCLIMVQRLPLGLGSIAVAKWAPMLRHTGGADAGSIYAEMIEALCAEYAGRRGMMLSVLPRASLIEGNAEYALLLGRGFRKGATLLFPDRYIVNLRLSDAEQRASFHQKWRYHLNKADKAGLSFEHAAPERRAEFDALYEQMVDRKKFPDHSAYGTVPALMEMANPALRPELFFVRHAGEIVAGAIIFKAGDRAVYLYGATSAAALELRAGYFLHWHIIRWLRDNTEARWYDLGGTDGFQGLHQFKKGMVGERGVITPVPPVANYAERWWPRLLGEAAFAGREIAHAVGRQVDRLRPDRAKPDQRRDA